MPRTKAPSPARVHDPAYGPLVTSFWIAAVISTLVGLTTQASLVALTCVTVSATLLGETVLKDYILSCDPFRPRSVAAAFLYFFLPITAWAFLIKGNSPESLPPPLDWEGSLKSLLIVYTIGTLGYRLAMTQSPSRESRSLTGEPQGNCAPLLIETSYALECAARKLAWLALGSLCVYGLVVLRAGGLNAYLGSILDRATRVQTLEGMGFLLVLAEAWPMLFTLSLACRRLSTGQAVSWRFVLYLAIIFALLQFGVGGLRGSRANTIWPFIIVLGIVHCAMHRVSRVAMVIAGTVATLFAFVYGIYKASGVDVVLGMTSTAGRQLAVEASGRGGDVVFFEDLGRLGIQTVVLDALASPTHAALNPPFGLPSYVGDLIFLLPSGARPKGTELWSKSEYGTELLYGGNSLATGTESTRIYGLVGEAMLNWGLIALPIAFIFFGLLVKWLDRFYATALASGLLENRLVAGSFGAVVIVVFVQDLDNVAWFAIKYLVPVFIAFILIRRYRRTGDRHVSSQPAAR